MTLQFKLGGADIALFAMSVCDQSPHTWQTTPCMCHPESFHCADNWPLRDTAASHPKGEAPGIMIAAFTFPIERSAAEFASTDDQSGAHQAASLRVR